jgi:hypothetical protein
MDIASRDNGSSRAPKFCCPPNARETKRESREARSGYRITCLRGIRGWPTYEDRDRREQSNAVEFPKTLTPSASVHWYHTCSWTRTYSLYLSLNTFSSRPFFTRSRANIHLWPTIANFFLSVQRSIVRIFLFLFTNFNYLHRNLTSTVLEVISEACEKLHKAVEEHYSHHAGTNSSLASLILNYYYSNYQLVGMRSLRFGNASKPVFWIRWVPKQYSQTSLRCVRQVYEVPCIVVVCEIHL